MLEFVLTFGGVFILGQLYAALNQRSGGTAALLGLANTQLNNFVLAFLFQFSVTILLVWLFTIVIKHASWRDLGFRKASAGDFFSYGFMGGVGILGLIMILSVLVNQLQPGIKPQDFERMLNSVSSTKGFLVMFLLGAVLAPFYEELLFRGMLYPAVRRYLGPTGGAVIAGLIFGLAHWDLWRTIPLAVGGFLFCYIYEKTDSILVTALAHGTWNGIMALVIYLNVVKMI
ncbi:MAG: lysostaphin resistance A-like protein [Deltaproteobacteria bacterium]